MKARIKATGDIVEVKSKVITSPCTRNTILKYVDQKTGISYFEDDLFFLKDLVDEPDYWTRLEHQYAGMAMQGMIKRAYNAYCDDCANYENMIFEDAQALLKDHAEALADVCVEFAHALVQKLKEKEERK